MDISYGPLESIGNKTSIMYAFERIWISIVASLITQIVIYGIIALLRYNETNFVHGNYQFIIYQHIRFPFYRSVLII